MTATMPQNNFEAVFVTPFYMSRDTHFTCFTSTLVQILTPVLLLQAFNTFLVTPFYKNAFL
jgi:hypothetical protein